MITIIKDDNHNYVISHNGFKKMCLDQEELLELCQVVVGVIGRLTTIKIKVNEDQKKLLIEEIDKWKSDPNYIPIMESYKPPTVGELDLASLMGIPQDMLCSKQDNEDGELL